MDIFGPGARQPDPRPDDDVAEIMVVCTGNVARSPLFMAMLEGEVRRRLGPDAPVWVKSSGVHGLAGEPAVADSRTLAEERGLDLSRHRGAVTVEREVVRCDLVLTMTESQRSRVIRRAPRGAGSTFTVREFARLVSALEPLADDLSPRERVRHCVRLANGARPYVERPGDPEDVEDPYGAGADVYAAMARELDDLLAAIAPQLFGPLPGVSSP